MRFQIAPLQTHLRFHLQWFVATFLVAALLASANVRTLFAADSATDSVEDATAESATAPSDAPNTAVAPAFATAFDDPPPQPAATIDAATFNGVHPGETPAKQLAEKWGEGKLVSHENGELVLSFALNSYPHVEATIVDDKVRTLVVNLQQSMTPEAVARKLQLENIRPVKVPDDSGTLLGLAYPERGVLFSFTSDGKQVSQVVLDRIDLTSFVLRAEADWQSHSRASLADLQYVLSRDSHNARALWLKAKILTLSARYDEALASVDEALSMEPSQPQYRLTRGEILKHLGQFEQAMQDTKQVLDAADVTDDVKAKAMCQLGDLLAAGPAHDYKSALEHHTAAIKLADPLSIDKRLSVRRSAKLLLVEAHLAVALDIAAGNWQQKEKVMPKWLDRASAYVDDIIAHEDGDPALRLHISAGALAACDAAQGKIDSVPWARMALMQGRPVITAADDPWTKQHLSWELGVALSDGLASDEAAGKAQHAMTNTSLTISYLEAGAQGRRETPDDAFRLGAMYFRLGSLHAVKHNDHKTAVAWYEKAYPLLDRPIPAAYSNQQGRYGDWLVSMGISYWETGMRDFALQLTDAGLQHVQEAVNRKLVDEKALAVPYSNLAFMHEAQGHKEDAQTCTQLAAKYDAMQAMKR